MHRCWVERVTHRIIGIVVGHLALENLSSPVSDLVGFLGSAGGDGGHECVVKACDEGERLVSRMYICQMMRMNRCEGGCIHKSLLRVRSVSGMTPIEPGNSMRQ